jgi:hypothetical protein
MTSQSSRDHAFAPDGHGLGAVSDEDASRRETGEGPIEMGSPDRIECGIDAGSSNASRCDCTHRSNEVTSPIVDCGGTKSLNCSEVRC